MDGTTKELYTIENGTKSLTEYVIASISKHRYEVKDGNEILYEGESYQHAKSIYEQLGQEVNGSEISKPAKTNAVVYQGHEINFKDNELVNLTRAWKAAGAVGSKAPKHWLSQDKVERLIETVAKKLRVEKSNLLVIERGRFGGTYAHWRIFLAYAKYLDREFHMWADGMVKERFEEDN